MNVSPINNFNYNYKLRTNKISESDSNPNFRASVFLTGETIKAYNYPKFNEAVNKLKNLLRFEPGQSLTIDVNKNGSKAFGAEDLEFVVGRKKCGFFFNNNEDSGKIAYDMLNTYSHLV